MKNQIQQFLIQTSNIITSRWEALKKLFMKIELSKSLFC